MELLIFCVYKKQNQINFFSIISLYISIIRPYILDIKDCKRGLIVFVESNIPSRRLNDFKIPSNIQIIPFAINLRKEKSSVTSIYNSPSQKN